MPMHHQIMPQVVCKGLPPKVEQGGGTASICTRYVAPPCTWWCMLPHLETDIAAEKEVELSSSPRCCGHGVQCASVRERATVRSARA